MIILALILHDLSRYLALFLFKEKRKNIRLQLGSKRLAYELSGLFMCFFIAFIIICTITIGSKERYLLNKNAIYGIEFSETAKELGFEDGDKILTINNDSIERFSELIDTLLFKWGDLSIKIERNNSETFINIKEFGTRSLLEDITAQHLKPLHHPIYGGNEATRPLVYEERQRNFKDAWQSFITFINMNLAYINPNNNLHPLAVDYIKVDNISSLRVGLFLLAYSLIFIGLVNFIPLPGFDLGNTIIAIIEKMRKKCFPKRSLGFLRYIFPAIFIILLLLISFTN